MWLNIRTGYSLKAVFGHLDDILERCKGYKAIGIADIATTYGHIRFKKACEAKGIKPIYGVRLKVTDLDPKGTNLKRYQNCEMTFIAANQKGLQEIYQLIDTAHKQFYQFPKITYTQLNETSKNIVVLSGISPEVDKIKRKVYLQLSPDLPHALLDCGLEPVACCDNYYPLEEDKTAYETLTADQWTLERKTTPQHIITEKEWLKLYPKHSKALKLKNKLLKELSVVALPVAPSVKYGKGSQKLLARLCNHNLIFVELKGKKYKKRLQTELSIIKQKDFADYFLVVADLIEHCKKSMPIGPARGSAAGSLVCYLLGITEIDPLKYDLLFERFIDINRTDWPDIDFDLGNQAEAIRYLQEKWGSDCVALMANINKMQPKSVIQRAARNLNIPPWELEEFKESIEERPEGDERASKALHDSFETSIGIDVLSEHPNLYHTQALEGHPSHAGTHAAGILVCPKPLNNFCGINSRTGKHIAMVDKRDAEEINLLKIDALGLTTLNILAETCNQLNVPYSSMYELPLDDKKTYKLINSGNLSGIFQMEGTALQQLASGMKARNIEDLAALSALCRPGPLGSGAANRFVNQRAGKEKVKYLCPHKAVKKWTESTLGNIIYQEQLMGIVREMGGLSWEDVTKVRKLMGKSQGDEAFAKYQPKFIKGAIKSGSTKQEARLVWEAMKNFGQYGFNKSHAIGYAVLTYFTAYFKANHPLEFAVGVLNNTNNPQTALKILRDLEKREGIKYEWFNPEKALAKWAVVEGKLLAGLATIDGIGPVAATKIINCRRYNKPIPMGIQAKLDNPLSLFRYLYPCKTVYKKYFKKGWKATPIKKIKGKGEYIFIGMLTKRALRDLNDSKQLAKRKGEKVKGPSAYVSMTIEDDTGAIDVSIGRFQFEEIGGIITDDTTINKDWFVCHGVQIHDNNKRIYIENIKKITISY